MRYRLCSFIAFLAISCAVSGAYADFIISDGFEVLRLNNSGQRLQAYHPGGAPFSDYELYGESFALTPDQQTVYTLPTNLGMADFIPFGVNTGLADFDRTINGGAFGQVNEVLNPGSALILPSDVSIEGDLFVTSRLQGAANDRVIQRFNRTTESYTQTISPPTPQPIYDFNFSPSGGRLYMAAKDGIFAFSKLGSTYSLVGSQPIIPGVEASIAVRDDGSLLVRSASTGNIDHYSQTGVFIETFIPSSSIVENDVAGVRGSMQFGPDGNLYIYQYGVPGFGSPPPAVIGKYNGQTGALISLTPTTGSHFTASGRISILAVPEPVACGLFAGGAVAILIAGRRRQR